MSDIIRRRALLGGTRNINAHESIVEYEYPLTSTASAYVTSTYSDVFGTVNIVDVNWPEGIKTIMPYSFLGSSITEDTFNSIPESVTIIGKWAFRCCVNISGAITLPPNLKELGDYALYYDTGITSITLPEVPCRFGIYCFPSPSTNLSTINITENVVYAFQQQSSTFNNTAWYTNKSNGDVYLGKNYITYKGTMPSNTNLTLDSQTISIAGGAFQSKSTLKSITIPNSVQYIGPYAFSGCTGLTSISIPESLNNIFYGTSNLTYVNSDTSNSTVSEANLQYSSYESPFYSSACTGITTVNYNAINFIGPGNGTSYTNLLYSTGLPNVTTVNIGNNVQAIPKYFIYNFKKITSITIPSSVIRICTNAFTNCTALTSITIPESVLYLETNLMNGCTGITTLNFNAISCIKTGFSSLSNPNPTSPANNSTSLWGTLTNLTTINIGNQVQIIPSGFLGSGQSKITSITIPSSVTTIGYNAFYGSKLTSIDLPSSVSKIERYAFSSCTSITSITVRATTPPTLDASYTNTFPPTTQNYKIYVPSSAVNTYKTADGWSSWASKIQAIP